MKKILVGLDNSDPSWRAFDLALELAKSLDLGKVGAIHVGKSTEPLDKAEEMARGEGIEIEKHLVEGSNLDPAVVNFAEREGIELEEHLSGESEADSKIVKFAEEEGYDHIVVGSRGNTGIKRVLLGSVADGVVRKAHCPVTVVRESDIF